MWGVVVGLCPLVAGCGGGGETSSAAPVPPPLPVTAAPAPPAATALPRAGEAGMRFGYNDDLVPNSPKLALLPGSGSDTIRLRLSWSAIEPQPGQFDWSRFDGLYSQLLSVGIRPLWVLVEAPCWAGDARIPCDPAASAGAPGPDHAADFAAFAAAVALRYPESLGLEVGNEVNDATFWPNGQDPVGYAALLRATGAAVDAVDPDLPVVAGGLAPFEQPGDGEVPWRTYLGVMIENGGLDGADAVAFHPYAELDRGEDPGAAVGALVDKVRAFLDDRDAADVPLWITEVGLSTAAKPPISPTAQASGLVSILEQLGARGIPVVIVHRLVDQASAQFPLEAGFGVVGADGRTLKPAYCALAAARGKPCG